MYTMWTKKLLLGVAFILTAASLSCATRNVLLLLGDDAGFQFGAYGNKDIKMPNLDSLAQRSLIYKNGFTSVSSCSPSRSVVLSGLPQHQNGMYGLHHSVHHFQSFTGVRSLPDILSGHGIRTGIIGKKHVGPDSVYKFDYEQTEENHNLMQIGRNITYMKHYVSEFLTMARTDSRPFFLYIGIHDPHRCWYGGSTGNFCENFGDGVTPGMGVIPDWKPTLYNPMKVKVPYFLPDTPATRQDLADMYKTYSRMDQGIGLFLAELDKAGLSKDTLVIYTSDNGIPFPMAKTNLYDPGMGEPFLVSSPYHTQAWGKTTEATVSTMDLVPTILDWFDVDYPKYNLNGASVQLTGKSILPSLKLNTPITDFDHTFSSHNFHEVTMYYPMRVMRNKTMKLIHNLNYRAAYPIATDLYLNPTFLDIINRTETGEKLPWITTLHKYYYRDEYQLYNLTADPKEEINLANDTAYQTVLVNMQQKIHQWQVITNDPWRCMPSSVLEGSVCDPMYNDPMYNARMYNDAFSKL